MKWIAKQSKSLITKMDVITNIVDCMPSWSVEMTCLNDYLNQVFFFLTIFTISKER